MAISGITRPISHLWSAGPPTLEFGDNVPAMLSKERYPVMLAIDLALMGHKLVRASTKPLF